MSHRLYAKRGTQLPWAKLNEKLVVQIRAEHAEKERKKKELDAQFSSEAFARRYRVSKNTIDKMLSYQTWVHV